MSKEYYAVSLIYSDFVVGPFETKNAAAEWTVRNQPVLDQFDEETFQETMISPEMSPEGLAQLLESKREH
jgi:hypothetical protein